MTSILLDRAKAWVAAASPTQEDLLSGHNNLVLRVQRGAETATDAEPALEYLGEAFVEAGGDPLELIALDVDEPANTTPTTIPVMATDTSSLVYYDHAPAHLTLDPGAKRKAFDELRNLLGTRHVSHV